MHHADSGVHHTCGDYQDALAKGKITSSMSRMGNAINNLPMASVFHSLESELLHHRTYATRDEARRDLFAYVEGFYNRTRLHSALGYPTPAEAEQRATSVA